MRRWSGARAVGGWSGWWAFALVFAIAAGLAAARPAYVQATADVVARDLANEDTPGADIVVRSDAAIVRGLPAADAAVGEELRASGPLDDVVTTWSAGQQGTKARIDDRIHGETVRIVARPGAVESLEPVDVGGPEDGVWVPQRVAASIGIRPGDVLTVSDRDWLVEVPVAGIYRDLDPVDLGPYWSAAPRELVPREFRVFGDVIEPQLLVVPEDTMFGLTNQVEPDPELPPGVGALPVEVRVWWETDLSRDIAGVDELTDLAAALRRFERRAVSTDADLAATLGEGAVRDLTVRSELPELSARVVSASDGVDRSMGALGLGASVVGLAVVAVGGWSIANRRESELRLWSVEGRGPAALGVAAAAGALLPAAVGTAAGRWLGPQLVRMAGPSSIDHGDAVRWAPLVVVALLGVVAVGTAAAIVATRSTESTVPSGTGWVAEVAVYGAALVLLAVMVRRDTGRTGSDAFDLVGVLTPVLASAAFVLLGLRLARAVAGRLRSRGDRLPTGLFLAWRRVSDAVRGGSVALVPVAVAVAIAVFASGSVLSLDRSIERKATVQVGGPAVVPVRSSSLPDPVPEGVAITRFGTANLPGFGPLRLMVIDPDRHVAVLGADAGVGLDAEELRSLLLAESDGRVPAVLVGPRRSELLATAPLRTQSLRFDYVEVGEMEAIPLMSPRQPTVVVAASRLEEFVGRGDPDANVIGALRGLRPHLVSSLPIDEFSAIVEALGVSSDAIETRDVVLSDPTVLGQRWAFSFLVFVAGAAFALSLLIFAFLTIEAHRRRVLAQALIDRMGVDRRSSSVSVVVELAGLMVIAVSIGAVAGVAVNRLLAGRFDPLPEVAPTPTMGWPVVALVVLPLAATAAALLLWRATQAATTRANVAEVLRGG